ncbi:phage/plasmid primase, P4 family [Cellulophaga baltica]|uniref:Putative DNA primase/helicase n=1 Tax=Cellulophaga baltica TaxID=76594 RepID=A0A1G7JNY4_9FLAO|nr:phage/plasmid primase, P4 family [Cellulophaga baltica]SDF26514.1 putative DNA primase/helicase [Cellulophaga baltica]
MRAHISNIGNEKISKVNGTTLNLVTDFSQEKKKDQVNDILEKIVKRIERVNFREYCKLKEAEGKLQRKHFLVSCIEILLKSVEDNSYSLCRKNNSIYLYNSEYWEILSESNCKDFLGDVALKMGVYKFDAKYHLFKDDLYKQFLSYARLKEAKSKSRTTVINLNNGTFEITSRKQILRPFDKLDFLTYQLPFDYNKESEAPQFKKFLDEVLPELELQNILAEYIGYIFIKNSVLKLEKVMLLFGEGANGKSVFFEILMALLGSQNVTNYSLNRLTDDQGNSRAQLGDKLLNYSSEINGKLESSIFKQLVSGEPVEARLLYKDIQIITDYARFMFNCNELPREVENTNAFFRRFIIIPFRITIASENQDKELSRKIINNELSGVFNWVLNGLTQLLSNKDFSSSKIVENEVLHYQKESDSVLMFLEDEEYQISFDKTRPLKEVYFEYESYCKMNHYGICSSRKFSSRLKKNGYRLGERKSYGYPLFIEHKAST